jgi:hypothetical protein
MIWFTLALFVVSFLITALLTPKPEFENARAQTLNDVNFPRATEDAPIPLVLGRVRMSAPNVTWFGNFRTIPITERVKTGLFSKTTIVVGHRYFLTMDLALAMGPGIACREIYVDDKLAWSGNTGGGAVTAVNGVGISFGGYKAGGAMNMGGNFYSGAFDLVNQPVDSIVEGQVGAGGVPAYLGTSHIALDRELGESAQLRKMAFVLECYTDSLGLPNNGKIGDDMNPAEALYQVLTDDWRGLGISPALIDVTTLQAIGTVLYNEGNGVSVQITAEATGKKVVEEILRQIDGVAYQDPETGRIIFKLIRDDYDPDLLPIYDEDDILKVENFSRSGWDEVIAQVKITFPQRDKESDAVAISQDMATAGMIGRLRSTTIGMPFCYNKTLANQLASRERAQLSVPLFRMTLQMNRNANTLRPGDVFKVNWPDYGISNLVLRVQEFDFGSLLDGKIVVRCLQDNFALDTVVIAPPPDSGWVAPIVDPQPILVSEILEMPRFFMNRVQFPIPDGNAGVVPLALKPSSASSGYDLLAGDTTGDLDVREPEQVTYPPTGTLLAEYDELAGFAGGLDATGFTLINLAGDDFSPATDVSEVRLGENGLLYANGEFMAFTGAVDNMNGSWTLSNIYRGLLGTSPKTHPVNTRVWQVRPELYGLGTLDDLAEDGTLYYKLLDRVGPTVDEEGDVVEASQVMARWARRGQRVRNLQLGAARTGILIDDSSVRSLTWARSNRDASLIPIETDGDEVPDISDALSERYKIEVYNNGVFQAALSADDITGPTSHNIDFSAATLSGPGEIRVITQWDETPDPEVSSVDYAFLPITFDQVLLITFADLFDTFGSLPGSSLKGVYSLRRRIAGYTGPLVRIRDSNDNSEQDIGQNEVGGLAPFTVVGTAHIVTVYDQSGNSLDVSAPADADEPILGAHPFRAGDYAMIWDGSNDILRGPTFNSGASNAHAIDRPLFWINTYRDAAVSGANEYMIGITHDVGENPTLTPFLIAGFVHTTSPNITVQWDEQASFYDTSLAGEFRGPKVLGAVDSNNIALYNVDYTGSKVIGSSVDWSLAQSGVMDYTGVELKALEIGNRTDQGLAWEHEIFEFGIGDGNTFLGAQMSAFLNAQARVSLAREIILINDAVPSTTEYAQGGAYPASALNPDHEVIVAFWCEDPNTDVDITVQGYDIDFVDEVGLYLNGNFVDYLNTTSNNAWGANDSFANLTPIYGWNIIAIKQEQTLSFVWGVRNIAVTSTADVSKRLWASFEGADAAVAYTERSFNKRAFTFNGNAQLDTAQFKFGTSSLLVDGTGDFVTLPDDDDWNFGSGEFTFEGWFRWNADPNNFQFLMGQFQSSGNQRSWALYRDGSGNSLELFLSENGSSSLIDIVHSWNPTLATWYHLAVDFDGTTYRLYIDGVQVASSAVLRTLHNSTALFSIGAQPNGIDEFNGWVDEVKVYKGAALYAGTCYPNASER